MMKKKVTEIQENDVLAKPIITWDYQIILQQGVTLKRDYIEKLQELGITEVFVVDQKEETNEIVLLRSDIEHNVREKVKDILERHTYRNNQNLEELSKTADQIISNILKEKRVVEEIYDIRERSTDIYEHSISICALAILTALKLKVESTRIHDIGVGCLLHEIGLRYTTLDFTRKDVESLNGIELADYKKHPINGYYSLQEEDWISEISKKIILFHHERMDGSGFPLRISEIPFECRIVNVCDAFDEMICGISRKQVKVHEVIEYLKTYRGSQFDSKVVDSFLSFTAVYPAGSKVLTNEGELAVVVAQNKDFQDRPVLRILKDNQGNDVKEEKIKDLMKIHNVFVEKVIN